jgi:DNA-binding response OmpR family regulator
MRLLIAEDEEQLSRAVAAVLTHTGYQVDTAANGAEAVELASENAYDCMIFDIMMPVMDGIEALSKIREKGDITPVILLTAKAEVEDRIQGLDAGADDYLTKPFAMGELAARIRSATRRKESFTPKMLQMGNISLNMEQQELKAVNSIRLAKKESSLLEYFLLNREKELSVDEIFKRVWADEPDMNREVVWVYVSYLRNKLVSVSADVTITGEKTGPYRLSAKS